MKTALNLLSPKKRQAMRTVLALTSIQTAILLVAFVSMALAGLLFSLKLTLTSMDRGLNKQSLAALQEYETAARHIREINSFITRTSDIQNSFVDWSAVLESIGHSAPAGIQFERMTVDTDHSISIAGQAMTRDEVLNMENILKANPTFQEVTSPLSNILQRENLHFEFNLKYVPVQPTP